MYTIYVKFDCAEGRREAFVERVKAEGILDAIRAEDGCLCYDYYFSEKNASELLLVEAWETSEHQRVHIRQPQMEKLRSFKDDYIKNTTLGEFELK